MAITIKTTINGQSVTAAAEPNTSLLEFIRDTLEMKGTKLCCNTGECGACTVIYNGKPINSCVTMAADAIGAQITTIEGLRPADGLSPVTARAANFKALGNAFAPVAPTGAPATLPAGLDASGAESVGMK